ncbi:MAG TPA: alpha/beta fold hydrolase [Chromatiales bacterium]|nr:alpha/beta fold hydrolase [Chromatiales bacterium]
MRLHYRELGDASRPPVILVHGLLGSSSNWMGVAPRLEPDYHLILPDLRNHGRSPHDGRMDYPSMAADLQELTDHLGIGSAAFIGHSMGAKAVMWLGLGNPERVDRLMSVDMAPVTYTHDFRPILDAMTAVDLATLGSRRDADAQLARLLPDIALRQYLLQNLVREAGRWRWRVNLRAIKAGMDDILGFPHAKGWDYPGTAWFVYGTESSYVTPEMTPGIRRLFPLARLRPVTGAGHWLYSEKPDAFVEIVQAFLS